MTRLGVVLVLLLVAPLVTRGQTTVFSDDFNTATSSTSLNGLKPDQGDAGGAAWTAASGITESGGVANLASSTENASLALDVTDVQSVTVEASVELTSGSTIDLFIATPAPATGSAGTGQLSLQEHRTSVGLNDSGQQPDNSVLITSGSAYDLALTYDLVDGTVSATINGTSAGSYPVFGSDALLTGISTLYVGFGSQSAAGTVDNFSVVTTPVTDSPAAAPEPSAWILLALSMTGGLWILRHRPRLG